MRGVLSASAYVPRLRLQRQAIAHALAWFNPALRAASRGERALANWDEDAITMAVEAARDALTERAREDIGDILLGSTTLPFADRLNAGIVKEALNLDDRICAHDLAGSRRAGLSALMLALQGFGREGHALCLAADRRLARPGSEAELVNGDAAAALVIGDGDDELIAEFIGAHSEHQDFVDQFRPDGVEHDYQWESRWIRDEGLRKLVPRSIGGALNELGILPSDIAHWAISTPHDAANLIIAKEVGLAPGGMVSLRDEVGYSGAADPLVLLVRAFERAKAGELILVAAFAQGCDALVFRRTARPVYAPKAHGLHTWLARRLPESNYIKHLFFSGALELDEGMRAELDLKTPPSMLYRDRRTILGLVGGRCRETGTVQWPKTRVSVSTNGRFLDTQDDYPLADIPARVVTFTADHLAATPDPPASYGMVDFEGGGRMMVDFTDVQDEPLHVGERVRMMFRLKRKDARGFKHYFWKAAPDMFADT